MPYAIFLVTAIFIVVILSVVVFAAFFEQFTDNPPLNIANSDLGQAPQTPDVITPTPAPAPANSTAIIGLIQSMSVDSWRLDVYLLEEGTTRSFFAGGATTMRNRFGDAMSFPEFAVGNVVEILYVEDTSSIEMVQLSNEVQPYRGIQGVLIDINASELQIGNSRFQYTERTIVRYNNQPISIEAIDLIDTLNVNVFRGVVVFVELLAGHGTVQIPHNPDIMQGVVEIGNHVHMALQEEGSTEIRIPEGEHRVVIRGANIEPFEYLLNLSRGQVAAINFDGLVLRDSMVVIQADANAVVTIDGIVHLPNEVIMLEPGEYTLAVTMDGYEPFEQQIVVDAPQHVFPVALTAIVASRNVIIATMPTGVRVYLDGAYVGLSPVQLNLDYGRYTLTFAREGYLGTPIDLWITEQTGPQVTFVLQPDPDFLPVIPMPTPPPIIDTPTEDDIFNYFSPFDPDEEVGEVGEFPSVIFGN